VTTGFLVFFFFVLETERRVRTLPLEPRNPHFLFCIFCFLDRISLPIVA
jgi:hypothetical protein